MPTSAPSKGRSSNDRAEPRARRLAHVLLLAGLWAVLTGGAPSSWWIGVPLIGLAAWVNLSWWPAWRLSPVGVLRFLPYFAYQSLAGGWDVALRALRPSRPLDSGLIDYRLRLPPGTPRVAMANLVSLLPGTLSADLDGERLVIHALDARPELLRRLRHDRRTTLAAVALAVTLALLLL